MTAVGSLHKEKGNYSVDTTPIANASAFWHLQQKGKELSRM